ncbi:hypothetical protein ACHAWO_008726 [Cyclotella atomus]|uniref:HSF-type DNA-binding domain-containing protein n=1 Tax=Cyclotella atomus TaxID=382360 RepID=A0ABD3MKX4_9STRA
MAKDKSTGFVVKLYQMVNGAPDDVLSTCSHQIFHPSKKHKWTPDGSSFRITDLPRLESETLPSYFRHSRFQSLVRQLNFYNFRKVNRERNIWVYHHPQFHRDHPQDLGKLRRRTCPGFDGRKQRIQRNVATADFDDETTETASTATSTSGVVTRSTGATSPAAVTTTIVTPESSVVKVSRSPSPSSSQASAATEVLEKPRMMNCNNVSYFRSVSASSSIDTRSSSNHLNFHYQENHLTPEQLHDRAYPLSNFSRDLNEIIGDYFSSTKKQGRLRGEVQAMQFGFDKSETHYSKVKCDLLTYDDEMFLDEKEDDVSRSGLCRNDDAAATVGTVCDTVEITPPTSNNALIASLINALCRQGEATSREFHSKIVHFLLTAHPQDVNLESKITALLHNTELRQEFHVLICMFLGGHTNTCRFKERIGSHLP